MNRKKGFTLAELLIVVAIIAVLVAIGIPVFTSQLEKAREATDLANVRSAYAEVVAAATAEDTSSELYDNSSKTYSKSVTLEQKQNGWSVSTPITIGGITSGDDGGTNGEATWIGTPTVGQPCVVSCYNGKVTIRWGFSGCILSGTPVMLADGSVRRIDDITTDDLLKTFDFFTGTAGSNHPMYVLKDEAKDSVVITLTMDSGTVLEMCDYQMFFDMDTREYFEINDLNYPEAVGKNIMFFDNDTVKICRIIEASAELKVCTCYEIFTEYDKNFVAAGGLTLEPDTWQQGVCTIGEDLTIDAVQYQADAEKYGLYTYDEFAGLMTEEQFDRMKVADVKIAVGKGLITEEEVFDLYREWMPVYDESIKEN